MKLVLRCSCLLLVLAMVACHSPRREARRMLERARVLADSIPDSTVYLIDSVLRMDILLSPRERMDMALLQGEVLFGEVGIEDEDIEAVLKEVSPVSELEHAAAYFAGRKEYAKATRAALYSGFVQQYYHEKNSAMQSYKEAEQYGTLAEDDFVVAKARCRMGKMLYDDYLEKDALTMFELAAQGFGNHYEERSLVENMKAATYIVLKQYDSATVCLQQSSHYANLCQCKNTKVKILNNYAVLHRLQGDYGEAIDCLKQIETTSDSSILFVSVLNIGKVFFASGALDSAVYYYQQVEELLPLVNLKEETRISAFLSLSRFAESIGDSSKALHYRKRYDDLLVTLFDKTEERFIYGIQRKYDYDTLQHIMNQRLLRRHRIIFIISIFTIIGFASLAIVLIRLVKIRKEEMNAKMKIFNYIKENKALSMMNEQKEKTMEDYALRFSEALKKEALTMCKVDIVHNNKNDKACWKALDEVVFGRKEHWDALMTVFDTLYPEIRESIALYYPELTEMEQKIFILSYFNLSREDEALMFGKSVHLVDKWRNGVRKKIREKK